MVHAALGCTCTGAFYRFGDDGLCEHHSSGKGGGVVLSRGWVQVRVAQGCQHQLCSQVSGANTTAGHRGATATLFCSTCLATLIVSYELALQVRLCELPEGAGSSSVTKSLLGQHYSRAHKLAMDPLCPAHCFYSCGEDGLVSVGEG